MSASGSQGTIYMFLTKALQEIHKEAPKKLKNLRDACQDALALIKKHLDDSSHPSTTIPDPLINKIVVALKLACESRQSKIMRNALDCFQKLMSYGFLRGDIIDEQNPAKRLMDKVLDTIGGCFDFPDDNVQLQIIKAFLTAVTTPACDVHDLALMNVIRNCYNIYLLSTNQANQTTAKATLTQMLNIIFQRLERFQQRNSASSSSSSLSNPVVASGAAARAAALAADVSDSPITGKPLNLAPLTLSSESNDTLKPTSEPSANANGTNTTTPSASSAAPIANGTASAAASSSPANLKESATASPEGERLYKDCAMAFRALCKLSNTELPDNATPDSVDMRKKALALELILAVLQNSGHALRKNERFINSVIKKQLCFSLLANGVSPVPQIFKLSLHIFLALVSYFNDYLYDEIGVFFSKIFLRILETANSTIQQKWMVLQVLYKICKNPQLLVDIFLNYDCNIQEKDIFERMTNDLSAIARGVGGGLGTAGITDKMTTPAQETALRMLGLECLVTIMKSLVDWSKELQSANSATTASEPSDESDEANPANAVGVATAAAPAGGAEIAFEEAKQLKLRLEEGKNKFNSSAKKGIKFLVDAGVLKNTPEDIARFLLTTEGLDKTQIGDYLGMLDPFNLKVLYAYCDAMNFAGMEIDKALRKFLSHFRLPGEGQKIDRIIEKFAERYYNDNPNSIFANADAAYVLAYSIIMLATDLHNPVVKTKITKEQWKKNHKGINDGKDFPDKFQDEIYDRIAAERLSLKDDEAQFDEDDTSGRALDPKQKQLRFYLESQQMIKASQEIIREKTRKKSKQTFVKSTNIEHVRPMFEISWAPVLAAFSHMLEHTPSSPGATGGDDATAMQAVSLCLEGIKAAVKVACLFFMETERNAFISTLSKFTLLTVDVVAAVGTAPAATSGAAESPLKFTHKNVACIKALIDIANSDANYLRGSWVEVLRCVSQLERMHLIGSGVKAEVQQAMSPARRSISAANVNAALLVEGLNASVIAAEIDPTSIDRIFANSVNLSDTAIIDFVEALCAVSTEEVDSPTPRIFSLQKLVEIAYYNMGRIRIVWSKIWGLMADHFVRVMTPKEGTNSGSGSSAVALYAIDSLRQLSMKFLEKEELANYHFQKDFLKPFEYVISNHPSRDIREMVVRCLTQMIVTRGANIKSGWKSMFVALTAAALDTDPQIVALAYDTVDIIVKQHFALIADTFFVECVNCLAAFANTQLLRDIALRAIDQIAVCCGLLAQGAVPEAGVPPPPVVGGDTVPATPFKFTPDNDVHIKLWFPLLTGLSRVVAHPHIDIRTRALEQLFKVLRTHAEQFDAKFWEMIFSSVIVPIFAPVGIGLKSTNETATSAPPPANGDAGASVPPSPRSTRAAALLEDDNEWLATTCLNAVNSLVKLFGHAFESLTFLFGDLLALLVAFSLHENESLAHIGATCLLQLVISDGQRFTESMWSALCRAVAHVFDHNCPPIGETPYPIAAAVGSAKTHDESAGEFERKLEHATPMSLRRVRGGPLSGFRVTHGRCVVQLLLIQGIGDMFDKYYPQLTLQHLHVLHACLAAAAAFAHSVNADSSEHSVRVTVGATAPTLLNLMVKQELDSIDGIFTLVFRMYAEAEQERAEFAEARLLYHVDTLLKEYVATAVPTAEAGATYPLTKTPLVVKAVRGIEQLPTPLFTKNLPRFYMLLSQLVMSDNREVRQAVQALFLRVGKLHNYVVAEEQPKRETAL